MISILQNSLKEKKRRHLYKNSEYKRTHYKYLKTNANLIGYLPINNLSHNLVHNYCLLSGSARSVYSKKFRLSRHQIKSYFSYITGLRLSSW